MILLLFATTLTLLFVALLHFYWAFGGGFWLNKALPTTNDGQRLLNPSKILTLIVGIVLLGFTYLAYSLYASPNKLSIYMGWAIALIFFLRAIGDFKMVGIFKQIKDTPFAYYDTRLYIPLSLFWSFSFSLLLYSDTTSTI